MTSLVVVKLTKKKPNPYIFGDEDFVFGVIEKPAVSWSSGEKGPRLHRLSAPNIIPRECALLPSQEATYDISVNFSEEDKQLAKNLLGKGYKIEYSSIGISKEAHELFIKTFK